MSQSVPPAEYFKPKMNEDKPRKSGEMACGVCFYAAVLVQVILSIAILASKNSEVAVFKTTDTGGVIEECPADYTLASKCRSRIFHGAGMCVNKQLCEDLATCTARRLSEQEPERLDTTGVFRRLAEETGPAPDARMWQRDRAARLLAGQTDVPENVWEFLEAHFYQPTVLFGSAAVLAGLWLMALQKAARAIVWGTIGLDVVFLVAMFAWYKLDLDTWNVPCAVLAVAIVIGSVVLRKKIDASALIMKTALDGLASNKRVFAACIGMQLLWVGYFSLFIAGVVGSHFVGAAVPEVATAEMPWLAGTCSVKPQVWAGGEGTYIFSVIVYYWVTFFFRNINLSMITANLSGWYFEQDGYKSFWVQGLKWSVGLQSGTTAMASAIMGISEYVLSRVGSTWDLVFSAITPWNWIFLLLGLCLKTILQTFSKFGLIASIFTGNPFCEAASKGMYLLKNRLGEAVLTDYLGSRVMAWATYLLALSVAFAAWAWADDVQDNDIVKALPGEVLLGMVIVFAVILSYPFAGLIFVVLIESIIGSMDLGQGEAKNVLRAFLNSLFAAIFMGSITMFILTAVSRVVVNAMDVIFFCYALSEELQQPKQERFAQLEESIKMTVISGVVAKGDGVVQATPVAGQEVKAAPDGPAPETNVEGQPMSV